jgi:hypothetical protein
LRFSRSKRCVAGIRRSESFWSILFGQILESSNEIVVEFDEPIRARLVKLEVIDQAGVNHATQGRDDEERCLQLGLGLRRGFRRRGIAVAIELRNYFAIALAIVGLLWTSASSAEPVVVRHVEGLVHGFLSLRTPEGDVLASGDLIQVAQGDRVTSRLVFHFKDGSMNDETSVFSQRGHFRLLSYNLVQKGPAFEQPLDMTIHGPSGHVTVRYKNEHGEEKVEDEQMNLPPDLANGMIITLLKNVRRDALPLSVSLVAATPKPRLVKLTIAVAGTEPFSIAGSARKATDYVLKVDIKGIAGVVAPLVGKQPPDSHVWILEGEAPAFVRSQAPMFMGGPAWKTDLVSPVWSRGR